MYRASHMGRPHLAHGSPGFHAARSRALFCWWGQPYPLTLVLALGYGLRLRVTIGFRLRLCSVLLSRLRGSGASGPSRAGSRIPICGGPCR
jgi:hypothetical protein